MPLSPLTRLLIVLTLLMFPWVFVTMMEPRSWLAPGLLGVVLSLWTAALFGIVKSGASFDERAFHPTRPRGRQRSFARSSAVMLGVIVSISLMAAIRGWHYNLGWQATWAGALIVFSLLFLFTAAVTTGFNLCFNQVRNKRWVGWIMVALPVLVHFVIVEMKDKPAWPGAAVFTSWTAGFSPAVMIAAALFGVAWWLAARRGMWWFSLITCGCAGLSLVAIGGARLRDPIRPSPPTRAIEIRRLPLVDAKADAGWVKGKGRQRTFDFIDFLPITGLAKDEILSGMGIFPFPPVEENISGNIFRRQRGFQLLDWQRDDPSDSVQKDTAWILASQLPSKPKVEDSGSWESRAEMDLFVDEVATILKQLDEKDWQFSGHIYRIVHQCELPIFKGGSRPMKALGHVKLRPAYQTEWQLIAPYRMVFPARRFDPDYRYSVSDLHGYALIVNRSGTATVKSETWYRYGDDAGVASTWINSTLQFPLESLSRWSADELEGATIHLFTTEPVASVNMTLAPPER
jgi:hypothetical protein